MKLVVIESPLGGDIETNRCYARKAMKDSLMRGEAPFASHLLYDQPGILDDTNPEERIQGVKAGFAWGDAGGELTAVYLDRGINKGMVEGIQKAIAAGRKIEFRRLSEEPINIAKPPFVDCDDWQGIIQMIPTIFDISYMGDMQ